MITSVNCNSRNNVSFNGIVKLKAVIVDDAVSNWYKTKNSAAKQVKKILMGQATTPQNKETTSFMQRLYHFFDPDYQVPAHAYVGDTRDIFAKVETSNGEYFLVSGKNASDIATSGTCIGGSKKLAQMTAESQEGARNYGKYVRSKDNYWTEKDEIATKFLRGGKHPEITIYMTKGKKDSVKITGFRLEDDFNKIGSSKYSNPIMLPAAPVKASKKAKAKSVATKPQAQIPTQKPTQPAVPKVTPIVQQPKEEKPLDLIKTSSMTIEEALRLKQLKKTPRKRKVKFDPNQTTFFDKLV